MNLPLLDHDMRRLMTMIKRTRRKPFRKFADSRALEAALCRSRDGMNIIVSGSRTVLSCGGKPAAVCDVACPPCRMTSHVHVRRLIEDAQHAEWTVEQIDGWNGLRRSGRVIPHTERERERERDKCYRKGRSLVARTRRTGCHAPGPGLSRYPSQYGPHRLTATAASDR